MEIHVRRVALALSALTAAGLMLTACGGSDSSSPQADPSQSVEGGQSVPQFWPLTGEKVPEDKTASLQDKKALRTKARNTIAHIAEATVRKRAGEEGQKHKSWLVTDFVTLGSALTHAYFLMCLGNTRDELKDDFARRVREREFPTCPPKRLDNDGLLAFDNPRTNARQVHNGAVFGLTRWTNIYFPRRQLFWGDAIGGGLSPIFGYHIVDLEVSTRKAGGADFFTHTAYWDGHQMKFGDGYGASLDVTAHELTHAITDRTANLEYKCQSGALNESMSDIFASNVDSDDWEIGEDLPGGALSPIFGRHIIDLEVSTKKDGEADVFTHTAYWDVEREPDTYHAPHIAALRKAVDLADTGSAIDVVDEGADPSKRARD